MDPLSISASIVALLQVSSTVLGYLSDVQKGPKELQQIRLEISSVLPILLMLQDQANEPKQSDSFSTKLRSLNMPEGPLAQLHAAMQRLAIKVAPVKGLRKAKKAIKWHFEKEETHELLDTIERLKSLVNIARQNDHIALSKAIMKNTETIHKEVKETSLGVHTLRLDERQRAICHWLSAPDPSMNYNKALKDRYSTTGDWLFSTNAYSGWLSTPGSLLWLYGIPGCGKTVLSSAVIQNTVKYCQSRTDSVVLYFYFDFNSVDKQQHENLIRSLITQLSSHFASTPKALGFLYSSCKNGESQPGYDSLLATLCQMMAELEEIYVVIDALDECLERQELLATIQDLTSWKDANLHVLTTSRREKDIEESMESLNVNHGRICIGRMLVSNDIRAYVRGRLQHDPSLERWQKQPKVQQEIEDTLMEKADGMFRWAACQLDSLRRCLNLSGLRKALASLPRTLDDTYNRILCNIDEDHYQYAFKVLQWLSYSTRPLELAEVAEVVAIDIEGSPRFDAANRFPEPRDILTICSSLISLEDETVSDSHHDDNRIIVRLAHLSVKEYLSSNAILSGESRRYSIQEIKANISICNDCLAYLLEFDGLKSLTSQILNDYPLVKYAARYWVQHAQVAERDSDFNPFPVTELLLTRGNGLLNSIRLYNLDRTWAKPNLEESSDAIRPPLYYASMAGLNKVVAMLLDKGVDVNASGGWYGNALQAALANGHNQVVQLLLENSADVNASGGYYGNALQAASFRGLDQVVLVQLLLGNGADVKASGGLFGHALQAASFRGHNQVVQLLLENGADVNASGGMFSNALQAASISGYDQVVQVLLERGADITALGRYGNALQAASCRGQEQVVKTLLEYGTDVDAQGDRYYGDAHYGTALHTASSRGENQIVKMLLDKGANVNDEVAALYSRHY